jgi:hypothetical protein
VWTRRDTVVPVVFHITIGGIAAGSPVVEEPAFVPAAAGVVRTKDGLLYVSSYDTGQVFALDGGSEAAKVADHAGKIEGLAINGDEVFGAWFSDGKIVRVVPPPNGPPLVVGGKPAGLAFEGGTFFFTDQNGGTVASIPRIGGSRTDLARVTGSIPIGIAVDGTHIYWTITRYILRIHR